MAVFVLLCNTLKATINQLTLVVTISFVRVHCSIALADKLRYPYPELMNKLKVLPEVLY